MWIYNAQLAARRVRYPRAVPTTKSDIHRLSQSMIYKFKLFYDEIILKMKQHHVIEIFSANCPLCKAYYG